jgi:hypothetical protein
MAVVINELEVAPQTDSSSGTAPAQAAQGADVLTPKQWQDMQRRIRKEQERRSRLMAY